MSKMTNAQEGYERHWRGSKTVPAPIAWPTTQPWSWDSENEDESDLRTRTRTRLTTYASRTLQELSFQTHRLFLMHTKHTDSLAALTLLIGPMKTGCIPRRSKCEVSGA